MSCTQLYINNNRLPIALNNRIFDDEVVRPDPVNLSFARGEIIKGRSITEVRNVYPIYKPEVKLGGTNVIDK